MGRVQRVGVTGHRPKDLPGGYDLAHSSNLAIGEWLLGKLEELNPEEACTGMALGVDQIFAQACIIAGIPFHAYVPCHGQEIQWPFSSRRLYQELIEKAASIRYTHEGPYPGPWCMTARNQDMVDWLTGIPSVLLAVWSGKNGGTSNCVMKAREAGLEIIRYNPQL